MPESPPRLVRAWLDALSSGLAEFDRDWAAAAAPSLKLGAGAAAVVSQAPAEGAAMGRAFGYFLPAPGQISFVLPLQQGSGVDPAADRVYVAGDFNGWQQAVGNPDWELHSEELDGEQVLRWTGPAAKVQWPERHRFKFVTGEHQWLALPCDAPNADDDGHGNVNRYLDPARSGRHLWRFALSAPLDLAERWTLSAGSVPVQLVPNAFFFELGTALPLGALTAENETVFRLFAPRARKVTLCVCAELAGQGSPVKFELQHRSAAADPGVWEVTLDQNMRGWFYWYLIDGVRDGSRRFDPNVRILDPYALAAVDRDGPGIVLEREWIGRGDGGFATPEWQDLVIAEAHVRDLTTLAPIRASGPERRGFAGLRRWVESEDFYLHRLGINCVELQPVQEFDNVTPEEYHWGYMPTNYFALESSYTLDPANASGVREFQGLVGALHRRGVAVLLDVVYNHVGLPEHLMRIDRLYYFQQDAGGNLANYSGCGNDLRARAAMATRLIVDSCTHLIQAYGIDGFRFDLAELLGIDVLREIERRLKRVKPDLILIAEPWSFRGHIAGALRDTGWASWNDTYRDFLPDYVRGKGEAERLEYFLRGSPWYYAKWPAQTVNDTESHDDRTWIDRITENPNFDGFAPTAADRRRTHLMAAVLFMSLGIPMLAAGQDFLRSKRGVTNTYQRGDLNALDYTRIEAQRQSHDYFAAWIAFRRGTRGRLLRHYSRPSETFFCFYRGPGGVLAAIYNADGSGGPDRLLFALNPGTAPVEIPVDAAAAGSWLPLADQDHFWGEAPAGEEGVGSVRFPDHLALPALGCGLWLGEV
ncbi:MAG TPA: alpha-amylase family glycosyl hydrolase [Opitutaceae bacterium]|nr:alpha-amylase family glycosyl hydrolase [Opitutaceae bacterium]